MIKRSRKRRERFIKRRQKANKRTSNQLHRVGMQYWRTKTGKRLTYNSPFLRTLQ